MEPDEEIKTRVIETLDTIPNVDLSELHVAVGQGVVTLGGDVQNHQTRFQVERTVQRISGIRGMASKLKPARALLHLPLRPR